MTEPNIPFDECRKYYDCEKNACPYYKEYIDPSSNTIVIPGMKLSQVQQIPVCIEKVLNTSKSFNSKAQQAAFVLSALWNVRDTINISFMPLPPGYPGIQPQWDGSLLDLKKQATSSMGVTTQISGCSIDADCPSRYDSPMACVNGSCVQNTTPLWYSKQQFTYVNNPNFILTPEDEQFEIDVRKLEPVEAIKKIIIEKIQPLVGLTINFVKSDGDIRIALDNTSGSWSYIGQQCKSIPPDSPTMNFGWLDTATIIHEFGHALGMIHEHQNPFGKGIDWNIKNVFAWANSTQGWDMYTTCQNILKKYDTEQVNGSEYDASSIMLYSYPSLLTNNNQQTYHNVVLSEADKLWLSSIYPKEGERKFPGQKDAISSVPPEKKTTFQDTWNSIFDNIENGSNIKENKQYTKHIIKALIALVIAGIVIFLIFRKNNT
jgi:hypothetical protein